MLHIGINGRSLFRQLTGVQHYALEVTRGLCELGTDDLRVSVFAGREGRGDSAPRGLPLDTSIIPADGPVRGLIWEQTLLRRMARKAGVDVLFSPANVAPLSPPAPGVVTVHDLAFLLYPQFFSRSFSAYYRNIIPRIVKQSAALITDSESTRSDLVDLLGADPDRVVVIPLGASSAFRSKPGKAELATVRERYRLPEHFFLSLSSLEPRKNLQRLVEAYCVLPDEVVEEYGLVLVGAGNRVFADPGVAATLSHVRRGRVMAPGYVPAEDLPAIYRLSTALVFPSLYEGFGLPPLEAMACGTPCVVSNSSALPEVTGRAAMMFNPTSIEQFVDCVRRVVVEPELNANLRREGLRQSALFSWERAAVETLEVYRTVLA